MRISLR